MRARSALALGGAIALAVPRFLGLEVGRVYAGAHPDEVPVALAQWALDRREPSWFLVAYGGGYHTPLQILLDLLRALRFDTALDLSRELSTETVYRFLYSLRAWSAVLSTAAVALVFCAGRALAGAAGGAVAALVLAAAPAAIRDAHLAKADAAATFAAALVVAALAHPFARPRNRAIALGAASGLALSTKYLVGLLPAAAFAAWRGSAPDRAGALARSATFACGRGHGARAQLVLAARPGGVLEAVRRGARLAVRLRAAAVARPSADPTARISRVRLAALGLWARERAVVRARDRRRARELGRGAVDRARRAGSARGAAVQPAHRVAQLLRADPGHRGADRSSRRARAGSSSAGRSATCARDSARGPRGRPSVGRAAHGTGDARNRYARARAGLDRSERAARRADRRVWRPAEQRVGAARSRAAQAVARDRSGAVAHRGGLARFTGVLRPGPRIEIYAVGRVQGESR